MKRVNKRDKKQKREYQKQIPEEIKILYGKFCFYSMVLILFFGFVFPFLLLPRLSKISSFLLFFLLLFFDFYIVFDVYRKRKTYKSPIYLFFFFLSLGTFLFSFLKLVTLS